MKNSLCTQGTAEYRDPLQDMLQWWTPFHALPERDENEALASEESLDHHIPQSVAEEYKTAGQI
jgi:hypothetical protein